MGYGYNLESLDKKIELDAVKGGTSVMRHRGGNMVILVCKKDNLKLGPASYLTTSRGLALQTIASEFGECKVKFMPSLCPFNFIHKIHILRNH